MQLTLVLDSNEYIFSLGLFKKHSCEVLFDVIFAEILSFSLRVSRIIVEEVRKGLKPEEFKEFILLVNSLTKIDEDFEIPFELGAKYEAMGLKPADALIAAYAEWVGADVLVSENRHFLSRQSNLSFKIVNAERCLSLIRSA